MKKLVCFFFLSILVTNLLAQNDTTKVNITKKNIVTVNENDNKSEIKIGGDNGIELLTDYQGDTTHIRIGRRTFKVIEGNSGTNIEIDKEEEKENRRGKFNPHWAGFEMGVNMYRQTDYSLYNNINTVVPENFMDLNYGKSLTVNINFAEWAFKNKANNFGLVTGLGFSFMDFTFDQPLTIAKEGGDGIIMPLEINEEGLKKSKLNVSYLTMPLMIEVKTPLRFGSSSLYLAGGVTGGLNLGSHTKYKYKKEKEKKRSNFNLNQFKYDLTGRIGLGDFCIFINYGMTPLFENDRGPELYPVTFGISFPNI